MDSMTALLIPEREVRDGLRPPLGTSTLPTLTTSWAFQIPSRQHKLKYHRLKMSQTLKNSYPRLLAPALRRVLSRRTSRPRK